MLPDVRPHGHVVPHVVLGAHAVAQGEVGLGGSSGRPLHAINVEASRPAPITGKSWKFWPNWKLYPITPVNHHVCMFGVPSETASRCREFCTSTAEEPAPREHVVDPAADDGVPSDQVLRVVARV